MLLFGKPIRLSEANKQITGYLQVRNHCTGNGYFDDIQDPKAKVYYEEGGLLSFVFEKEILDNIFKTPWCNGLRVYYACLETDEKGKWGGAEEEFILPAGTPTVVLIPCAIGGDGTVINLVPQDESLIAAGEHPGIKKFTKSPNDFDLRNDN